MNTQTSTQVERISRAELSAILRDEKTVNGCTFVGFDALTEPKMNKTIDGKRDNPNPHFGKVRKVLTGQVAMLFSNKTTNAYENMVNRRLVLDGKPAEFKVSKRSWGTRIEGTSFVEHTNKDGEFNEYLSVIYSESPVTLAQYVADLGIELTEAETELIEKLKRTVAFQSKSGEVDYVIQTANGWEAIEKKNIIGLVEKDTEGAQGGLSEAMKVVPRDFKLASLQRISMGGKVYLIAD